MIAISTNMVLGQIILPFLQSCTYTQDISPPQNRYLVPPHLELYEGEPPVRACDLLWESHRLELPERPEHLAHLTLRRLERNVPRHQLQGALLK